MCNSTIGFGSIKPYQVLGWQIYWGGGGGRRVTGKFFNKIERLIYWGGGVAYNPREGRFDAVAYTIRHVGLFCRS